MKGFRLAIFLTVFFVLYALLNFYIYTNATNALVAFAGSKGVVFFNILFYISVFAFPFARILGKWLPVKIADFFALIGGMWFAAMLYLILALVSIDLAGLIISFIPFVNDFLEANSPLINPILFLGIGIGVLFLLIFGYVNAINPRVKKLQIHVDKKPDGLKSLHVIFASDIHLGHVIGKKTLKKILTKINNLNPDVVLFPGDLVDEELKPVVDKKLGEYFKMLKPKYGIFAVTGNHEYIGGVESAVEYLSKFGIRFLRDEFMEIDKKFIIAGREDISTTSFQGKKRKPVKELLERTDPKLPVIMMDHQPIALLEAKDAGVDLQVSGHTHHGQMWPLQAITKRVFKLSWGYQKMGASHFYVSSGAGSWGPRVRIGNHPEIVSIKIEFAD